MDIIEEYLNLTNQTNRVNYTTGRNQLKKIRCTFKEFHIHTGINNGDFELTFLESDIYRSAITVGKGSYNEILASGGYSLKEIMFRIYMIGAFLNFEEEYIKKSDAFYLLDPSEKGAINYFFGMIFSNLMANLELNVKWLIHLDSYDKNLIDFTKENNKKPDFIGITNDDNRIVLESKGWVTKKNSGIKNAIEQLRAVLSVEGEQNILKVASIFYEKKNKDLQLEVIDPKENKFLDVVSGNSDYLKDYYARVYILLKNSEKTVKHDNCIFVIRKIDCSPIEVGLLKEVYDIIDEAHNNEDFVTEKIKEITFTKEQDLTSISKENNFSVGLDGVILKILDNEV